MRRQQCTVRFQRSPHGPAAVLLWRGRSLNYLNYPKHHKLTLAEARLWPTNLSRLDAADRSRRRRLNCRWAVESLHNGQWQPGSGHKTRRGF
jgi:hypothetical protein